MIQSASKGFGPVVSVLSLEHAVERLIDILDQENRAVAEGKVIQHGETTERKNQALRHLMVVQRSGGLTEAVAHLAPRLHVLKALLSRNARLLKTHIAALGDVTDVIIAGMRAAESDGTYTRLREP